MRAVPVCKCAYDVSFLLAQRQRWSERRATSLSRPGLRGGTRASSRANFRYSAEDLIKPGDFTGFQLELLQQELQQQHQQRHAADAKSSGTGRPARGTKRARTEPAVAPASAPSASEARTAQIDKDLVPLPPPKRARTQTGACFACSQTCASCASWRCASRCQTDLVAAESSPARLPDSSGFASGKPATPA